MPVTPASAIDEAFERRAVQPWQQDRALVVLEKFPVGLAHWRPVTAADAQHQQAWAMATQGLADALALGGAERGPDQQQSALAKAALGEQGQALVHGKVCPLARLGHDRGVECFEQVACCGQVVGQRHQGMRRPCVDHQCGLAVTAVLEYVEYLATRLLKTIGRAVLGQHLRGQFQQDDQRIGRPLAAFLHALPARAQQGQHHQQPGKAQGYPG